MKATVPKRTINEGYYTETHYQRRLPYRNALSMKGAIPKRTINEGYYIETHYQYEGYKYYGNECLNIKICKNVWSQIKQIGVMSSHLKM